MPVSLRTFSLSLTSLCLLLSADSLRAEDWHATLRGGAVNAPRYSGSDERVTAPLSRLSKARETAALNLPLALAIGLERPARLVDIVQTVAAK